MSEVVQNDSALFHALGFKWDRAVVPANAPVHDVKRACFRLQKMLAQYVFDASVLEGNPFTSNGIDAISIPATRAQEFNEKMVDFYINRDATVMMAFMMDCHPDAGLMGL